MNKKKLLALILSSAMIIGSLPMTVFADTTEKPLDHAQDVIDIQEDKIPVTDLTNSNMQPSFSLQVEAASLTDNILGEVFANTFNTMQKNQEPGGLLKAGNTDEHHERSFYGNSARLRDLEDENYLVYQDSFLIISHEDSSNYSVSYSDDKLTAYVSPAISDADLEEKTGIVFLADSIADDIVLVFDGAPYAEDGKLVVPLAATEDLTLKQIFSDGKLAFHGECHNGDTNGKPSFDWEENLSGTNWSGKITDERINDVDFVCDVDLWGADISFGVNLDLSIDFDITTTGASGGMETSKAVSITIPVGTLFNADVIYSVRAQFEDEPIHVKGTLQTNFDYTFSIIAGGEIHNYRNPVTISELKVLNPEDYNKAVNFYLGSQITSRFAVLEYSVSILWWDFKIGPVLSLNANWYGGCFILARHEKDQYGDKPDPTKDKIHICAKNGEDGCLSLNLEERYGFNINITVDFTPIADDPWVWSLYDDDHFADRTYYYNSYTFKTGMKEGICPHIGYRLDVTVDTTVERKSAEGAVVSYSPVKDSFDPYASAVVNKDNKAVLFAPAGDELKVTAELTSPHDSSWKISKTETLDKTDSAQQLNIVLDIPENHVYFKNSESGTPTEWPNDFAFSPFLSENVKLPSSIPGLSGRQFICWNTAEDGSGKSYAPGSVLKLSDDLTLWAQWKLAGNSWYVIYDANGGTSAPKPQIVQKGQDAVLSSELPEAGALVFRGWALDANAAAPDYQPGDTLPYDSAKNVVVLYALWELDPALRPIHVTYDANGLNGAGVPSDEWIERTCWLQLSAAVAPLGGEYVFSGWSKAAGATTPDYLAGNSYCFDSDTTLYAVWEKQPTVTLTFEDSLPGGASGIPDPITIVPSMSRDVRIPSAIPQKGGRQFTGWNTEKDGSGTSYAPGSVITLNADTTLWAQWEMVGNSWYVIYDANGGTSAPKPQIVQKGQDAVLSSELPEAGALVFRGWALDANAASPDYQPGDTLPYDSTKNAVVLYALWELDPALRPIVISFDANGGHDDRLPHSVSVPQNTWFVLPDKAPVWDLQHRFLGWSTDPNATEPRWLPGSEVLFYEDTTLYAIWENLIPPYPSNYVTEDNGQGGYSVLIGGAQKDSAMAWSYVIGVVGILLAGAAATTLLIRKKKENDL